MRILSASYFSKSFGGKIVEFEQRLPWQQSLNVKY